MQKIIIIFISLALNSWFISSACYAKGNAILIKNSLSEIKFCQGKLKLKLVRIWGGENEDDEMKFFETPTCVAVSKSGNVYICDKYNHCIREFTSSGKYVRTIGRRGKGPGDLITPHCLALCPNGDLWVLEYGGLRLQRFDNNGKSKKIIKTGIWSIWACATSLDELVLYDKNHTFKSRKLLSLMDSKGNRQRDIGQYHDNATVIFKSEGLSYAIDNKDNFYAANSLAPVIRKYSRDGDMQMAITYEVPFEVPFKVTLNENSDEIVKEEFDVNKESVKTERSKGKVVLKRSKGKGKPRPVVNSAITIDTQGRIFVGSWYRQLTDKEQKGLSGIIVSPVSIQRVGINYEIAENLKAAKLFVFNSIGKIIATAPLPSFCEQLCIHGSRIFVVDGRYNQRVLEYEMKFED